MFFRNYLSKIYKDFLLLNQNYSCSLQFTWLGVCRRVKKKKQKSAFDYKDYLFQLSNNKTISIKVYKSSSKIFINDNKTLVNLNLKKKKENIHFVMAILKYL